MKPRNWKQGDPISAARLNDTNTDAARSRRQFSLGSGSSMVNETMGNQSSLAHEPGMRFVTAVEDFAIVNAETDIYALNDPQYHGLCKMMRLNSGTTGLYEEEVHSEEFRVWDPIALLTASASKVMGDVFYTVYNKDSKRWEVLSAASSSLRPVRAITRACITDGWYYMELTDEPVDCPSASVSASDSVNECDICSITAFNDSESGFTQCDNIPESGRLTPEGNGIFVNARDLRTVPLKIGGTVLIQWTGETCISSASASASASDDLLDRVYYVLTGEYEIIRIPHQVWECCPITNTIKMVECWSYITEGAVCPSEFDPCSASASESV